MHTRESPAIVSPPRRVMSATRVFAFPIGFFRRATCEVRLCNPVAVLAGASAAGGPLAASFFYRPAGALSTPAVPSPSTPAGASDAAPAGLSRQERGTGDAGLTPRPERFRAGAIIALAGETVAAAVGPGADPAGEFRLELSPAIRHMSAHAIRTTDHELLVTEAQPMPAVRGHR
jgi:hypothetical protein